MENDEQPISISLGDALTFRNAFRFPIQSRAAKRDLVIGALLLLIPIAGWVLNMGHRLEIVHRMLKRQAPWPAWSGFGQLFVRGLMTTLVIVMFHVPGGMLIAVWFYTGWAPVLVLGVIGIGMGVYVLPGFMTFYAESYDAALLRNPMLAFRRVLAGGSLYAKAWVVALSAWALAFLGLLAFGIGFLFTSVWFWQVAAFSFGSAMARTHGLLEQEAGEAG